MSDRLMHALHRTHSAWVVYMLSYWTGDPEARRVGLYARTKAVVGFDRAMS